MVINLIVIGLIFTAIGALALFLKNFIFIGWYQKDYTKPWNKRYSWHGWRPFYKNTWTHKWVIKLNHIVIVDGFLPPKDKLEILGFLLILIGTILQIIGLQ
ncbi:hypothetical protein FJZ19_02800 [Candidatus Pacearchaeota archaeon]|nr:hypothetical protein [Candidatus Pacearchaeota archaeon]